MNQHAASLSLVFDYLPCINFALHQNRIPMIHRLILTNRGEAILTDLRISLTANPEFGTAVPLHLDRLEPGAEAMLAPNLVLSATYLASLTERLTGNYRVEVFSGNECLLQQDFEVVLLAYDQWCGLNVHPEVLAAYITPNHVALAPVLHRAAAILEQWTGSPSLDEYQSRNPDRVRKQMAAIYAALGELEIIYNTPPAGFEESGQRVRLADTVLSQRLGTCLDMALLYAGCLEAIGIHTLIVVTHGHAFAAGWLQPETFPDAIVDDATLLTKRMAAGIHELVTVETTGMNAGRQVEFDEAVRQSEDLLGKGNAEFVLALDVKRARFSGIRPIPQRIADGTGWRVVEDAAEEGQSSYAAPQTINPYEINSEMNGRSLTKQTLWERRLLDLSLRNSLLNIRITKNLMQLMPTDWALLEDALTGGSEFSLFHRPSDMPLPEVNYGLYPMPDNAEAWRAMSTSEVKQKRLRTFLSEQELGTNLTHLYRTSRASLEENGANTLYLTLGLLRWYETPTSERPRYAPILLVPVELVRKPLVGGYVLRTREEETMVNITLLEMLRQNFDLRVAGLEILPTDEQGVDVPRVFATVRHAVKDMRRWEVEEQGMLGIFSFSKFILWNDIHNNADKLAKSPIVASLMEGQIRWEVESTDGDATQIEQGVGADEVLLPISADSSQLEAVYEAVGGRSFILHGPPGTGKSQTITNIIANALYRGKRVLFVAEKMAALSVVEKRLKALGIGDFCLELHSNKAKKSAVLTQLRHTTELVRKGSPEGFAREAERLAKLRTEQYAYVEALHHRHNFGLSLYDAIVRYLHIEGEVWDGFPVDRLADCTPDVIDAWEEAVDRAVSAAHACGHPFNHPLNALCPATYSASLKDEAAPLLAGYLTKFDDLYRKIAALRALLGSDESSPLSPQAFSAWEKLAKHLAATPLLPVGLLTSAGLSQWIAAMEQACLHGRRCQNLRKEVEAVCRPGVLTLPAESLLQAWTKASADWFLPRFFGRRKVCKALSAYAHRSLDANEVPSLLECLVNYRRELDRLKTYENEWSALSVRNPEEADWEQLSAATTHLAGIQTSLIACAGEPQQATRLKETLASLLGEGLPVFKQCYGDVLDGTVQNADALQATTQTLQLCLGVDWESLCSSVEDVCELPARVRQWQAHLDSGLKDWYQWLEASRRLEQLGLNFVVAAVTAEHKDVAQWKPAFRKTMYQAMARHILSTRPELELFNGKMFNDVIVRYKESAVAYEALTRQELFAKMVSAIPSFTQEAVQNSEVGLLQRNIRNNGRGMSIRKLFDQMPTLLSRMAPCMLMSPLSVAQYIDPDSEPFDLIIFDEASQMPTSEAVGAIARGKKLIVVGDPKQMPPTNFFSVNTTDEENPELKDLESVLDDCLALSMPSKYLLWHYRSKHESLITFSNEEYYESKLMTFPSPDNIRSKVQLIAIDGHYDKGRTRQNKAEAKAVVDEIARRLRDEELRKRSIGVVTFSMVQQSLIEDMLADFFVTNPDLEVIATECEEPLFVKNLENVQGDERDVILFSVGYGPDADGKVSMNFGPLNRVGGERRLNVAVTRSRYEMLIFSTLRSEQIDLNRTSSVGVAGLKRFLEFAERGSRTKAVQTTTDRGEQTPGIEQAVAERLRSLGYEVHTDIGCSGYRIGLGVVDARNKATYRLGIVCDGVNYHRTKTVRDREIVQGSVLRMLGWRIFRLWTLDWWEKPDEVLAAIVQAIESDDALPSPSIPPRREPELKAAPTIEPQVPLVAEPITHCQEYVAAELKPGRYKADAFFEARSAAVLREQAKRIAEQEAPICKSLLVKRMLSEWGIGRVTKRMELPLAIACDEAGLFKSFPGEEVVYWLHSDQWKHYEGYRTAAGRTANELPPEEVANAVKHITEASLRLALPDLLKGCSKAFGFVRTTAAVDAAMRRGVEEAIRRGFIVVDGEMVKPA